MYELDKNGSFLEEWSLSHAWDRKKKQSFLNNTVVFIELLFFETQKNGDWDLIRFVSDDNIL